MAVACKVSYLHKRNPPRNRITDFGKSFRRTAIVRSSALPAL
jgi:hypothetical protein